jgi:hypothetical protein
LVARIALDHFFDIEKETAAGPPYNVSYSPTDKVYSGVLVRILRILNISRILRHPK